MSQPLVSITLPSFNHGRYLREAIESVLDQSYRNLEILFVDDGSTDDTQEIIRLLAARDERLKPVRFDRNRGVMTALRHAFERAQGKYLYQFSSDDVLFDKDFFSEGVDALEETSVAGFFGYAATISAETGHALGRIGSCPHHGFVDAEQFLRSFLRGGAFVPGISSLWRRSLLLELGGYDESLGPQADYFVNHVLASKHGIVFTGRVVAHTRISETGASYSSGASVQQIAERFLLFERKMRAHLADYPGQSRDWDGWRAAQLAALTLSRSKVQSSVSSVKRMLRGLLPAPVFRLANLLWRFTLGKILKGWFRLNLSTTSR